ARVVTSTGGSGGYAERVAVDATAPFVVPDGLGLDAAVALLADGRTATMLLDAAGVGAGERVLVEAAAGAFGGLLVQLARSAGATAVAAAGGPRKVSVARDLGTVARNAFELLRRGGRMVNYGIASGEWADVPSATPSPAG